MLILVGGDGSTPLVLLACKSIAGAIEASLEVKDNVFQCLQFKTDESLTCHPFVEIRWDIESEIIDHITDSCFSMVGEFL